MGFDVTRAWIIGNGPSLKDTPLDLLKDEVTFACNAVHLIYPKTKWRPSHYIRAESPYNDDDDELAESLKEAFKLGIPCWMVSVHKYVLGNKALRKFQQPTTVENYFPVCEHNRAHFDSEDCPSEWHLPGICTFGSSANIAMQIAVKLGYGPLYLVGCDLGYVDGGENHFDKKYERPNQELRKAKYANGDAEAGHWIAFRSCPVQVWNCTVGGSLEVYPRMTIEEVLNADTRQTDIPQGDVPGREVRSDPANDGDDAGDNHSGREEVQVGKTGSVPRPRRRRSTGNSGKVSGTGNGRRRKVTGSSG